MNSEVFLSGLLVRSFESGVYMNGHPDGEKFFGRINQRTNEGSFWSDNKLVIQGNNRNASFN